MMSGRRHLDSSGAESTSLAVVPFDRCGGCSHIFSCSRESRNFSQLLAEHWKICPVVVGPSGANLQQIKQAPKLPHPLTAIQTASSNIQPLDSTYEQIPNWHITAKETADAPPHSPEALEGQDLKIMDSDDVRRKKVLEEDERTSYVQPHSVRCNGCKRHIQLDSNYVYVNGFWDKHRDKCPSILASEGGVEAKKRKRKKSRHDGNRKRTTSGDYSPLRKSRKIHSHPGHMWPTDRESELLSLSQTRQQSGTREDPPNHSPPHDEVSRSAVAEYCEPAYDEQHRQGLSTSPETPRAGLFGLDTINPDDGYWKVQPFAVFETSSPHLTARGRKKYRCSTRYELLQYSRWGPAGRRWSS
ncbi:hypothetical protein FPV67DRAFT_1507183 [Lyophyllum atratum]|nr:hypothetical protein FPV67DRAFT_1507183 [Lyophyllum atratum]